MSPKRTYWLTFVASGLSVAIGVALDLAAGAADTGIAAAAAGAVTVTHGTVVALCDPGRARFPSDWEPLEHGVVAAGLYTVGIAFQLYVVVT